jgi:hypothetical protein
LALIAGADASSSGSSFMLKGPLHLPPTKVAQTISVLDGCGHRGFDHRKRSLPSPMTTFAASNG